MDYFSIIAKYYYNYCGLRQKMEKSSDLYCTLSQIMLYLIEVDGVISLNIAIVVCLKISNY